MPELEGNFQTKLIKKLHKMFDGCMVLKNDPDYIQGIPDLLVIYHDKWAALEVKRSPDSPHQPNQDYYVKRMNDMSFARFVYPENENEVLDELQRSFAAC